MIRILISSTLALVIGGMLAHSAVYDFTASGATYRMYVPASAGDVPVVRGAIFMIDGTGGDWRYRATDPAWQEAARSLGFVLVGVGTGSAGGGLNSTTNRSTLESVLSVAADVAGRPELVNVPVVYTGFSAGGITSACWALTVPDRIIAIACHRGFVGVYDPYGWGGFSQSNPYPFPNVLGTANVYTLLISGELDGTQPPGAVSPMFATWRDSTNNSHAVFAVDWGRGHNSFGNQGWSMAWTWIAEAIAARYPQGVLPSTLSGNLIVLNNTPIDQGWLGERPYIGNTTGTDRKTFLTIAPYNSYTGVKTDASWLPNETTARVYRAFTSADWNASSRAAIPLNGPLRITGDAAPSTVIQPAPLNVPPTHAVWTVGSTINITVDPREFDDQNSIISMEFYNGANHLGTLFAPGPNGWTMPCMLATRGIHSLTVVATNSLGAKTSAFCTVVANPEYTRDTFFYRYEKCPGFTYDHYDIANAIRGAVTGSGPITQTLSTAGSGSRFPRAFDFGANLYAATFNTDNTEYFAISDRSNLPSGTTSFTIEAFINLATSGSGLTYRLICGQGSGSATVFGWHLLVTGEGSGLGPRNLVLQFTADGLGQTSGSLDTVDSDIQIATGVDYYVACVINPADTSNNGIKFYVKNLSQEGDLLEVKRTHSKTSVYNSTASFTIGSSWNSWSGLLDEVRLTTRALTPGDLLVNHITSPLPSGLPGWRYTHFGTLANSGDAGDLADPTKSGFANLMKYALGLIPEAYLPTDFPATHIHNVSGTDRLALTFTRLKTANDVTFIVQAANDPGGPWIDIDPLLAANQISLTDNTPTVGVQTIVVQDTQALALNSKRFMRLKVISAGSN